MGGRGGAASAKKKAIASAVREEIDQGQSERTGTRTRLELEDIESGKTGGRFSTVLGRVEVWHYCSLVET